MEMDKTAKIAAALNYLGYNSGYYIEGEKITWVDEPPVKPSQKQIDDKVKVIESILETKAEAEKALKVSAYTKLGLTEEEIKAIL
jgi:hypothetical protein